MPPTPSTRTVLRQSRLLLRRNNIRQASTAAETASKAKDAAAETAAKAKDTASGAASKASEGLTRVQSSASSAISGAAASAQNVLSSVGGRTGRVIHFVESLIPPTVYYARVGMELSKIVFKGQKMAPPSLSQVQGYLSPLSNAVKNPKTIMSTASNVANSAAASPESILGRVRNVSRGELITVGVVFAEVLGFFTVGEMIGRRKLVGYGGKEEHGEH